ncbi:MAG: enolase-phosphatase E1 [Pseudoalteromonas tetraodonis]|jgi:enolase-phosphatase E1
MTVKAIITDIEGTTTDIAFVHKVLFPYASEHLPHFIRDQLSQSEVAAQLSAVSSEVGAKLSAEQAIEQLLKWIADDVKAPPLKALQGMIWKHGYENGDFQGHLYDDAANYLSQWHRQDIALYVYSSGSIQAQKLLYGFSSHGDLTPLFSDYFDTAVGHKQRSASYAAILERIPHQAEQCLFLSDVVGELDAAADNGIRTALISRGEQLSKTESHQMFSDFEQVHKTFITN